jgi:hypothetical protein
MTIRKDDRRGALLPRSAPRQFHLLAKPTGAVCNPGLHVLLLPVQGTALPRQPVPDGRGSARGLPAAANRGARRRARGGGGLAGWRADHDGPGLLPPLDRTGRTAPAARPRITHTIQTNGTLLDDSWAAFFRQHGFLVGLSIDGPRELHDAYRVDKGGKGSFDRVMRGLAASRWPTGTGPRPDCASTPRPAGSRWPWNTPETCTPAITSSSPPTGWATSARTCWTWWPRRGSRRSAGPSGTRCPATAWTATCGSPATAAAPKTGSPPPWTANPA